jgi:acetoin utilization protein AcuB
MNDSIRVHMTPAVWTIGQGASLATARGVMNERRIRHLPVLHGGRLVGVVSQRDIQLLETLKDVDPKEVTVEEAMSQDVLVVDPEAPLAEVARKMAARKSGSALVADDGVLCGIFTTVDALRAIDSLLSTPAVRRAVRNPSAARRTQSKRP